MRLLDLTQILPSQTPSPKLVIEGGRKVVYVPKQRYEALKAQLGNVEKLFIAYEDERSVIIAGFNGDPNKPAMMKIPRATLYGDIRSLVRVLGF